MFVFVVCGFFIDFGFGVCKWCFGVLGLLFVDDGVWLWGNREFGGFVIYLYFIVLWFMYWERKGLEYMIRNEIILSIKMIYLLLLLDYFNYYIV